MDSNGNIIISSEYQKIHEPAYFRHETHDNKSYFFVKKDGKFGLIDSTNGRQITPIIYDSMKIGNDNSVVFQQNAVFGWMDYEGSIIKNLN